MSLMTPRTMKTMIAPNSEPYNDIIKYLQEKLNLPDELIELDLSVKALEPIVVTTTYYPRINTS